MRILKKEKSWKGGTVEDTEEVYPGEEKAQGHDCHFQHLDSCCIEEELYTLLVWPQRSEVDSVNGDYKNKFQLQRRKDFS